MMRLASWNVNSIRARSESVVAWARTTRGGRQFDLLEALAPLSHQSTWLAVAAERAVSRAMGGSCSMPLAAHAVWQGDSLQIEAAWGVVDDGPARPLPLPPLMASPPWAAAAWPRRPPRTLRRRRRGLSRRRWCL